MSTLLVWLQRVSEQSILGCEGLRKKNSSIGTIRRKEAELCLPNSSESSGRQISSPGLQLQTVFQPRSKRGQDDNNTAAKSHTAVANHLIKFHRIKVTFMNLAQSQNPSLAYK